MTYNQRVKAFRKELKELLAKHQGCISWSCSECSDMHGVNDSHMSLSVSIGGTHGESIRVTNDDYIVTSDL